MQWRKKRKITSIDFVEPDEIFLDTHNSPAYDRDRFEGRIEQPISSGAIITTASVLLIALLACFVRVGTLQIVHGSEYFAKSEQNSLVQEPIFAERGIIYDRNNVPLATNMPESDTSEYPLRSYIKKPGFAHLLGYVNYPAKDSSGFYWQTEYIGRAGVEAIFNDELKGQNGLRLTERNALGGLESQGKVERAIQGKNISLSIDARLQEKLYESISSLASIAGYVGGSGLVMDIHTGELLAMVSYPEFDPSILSEGSDSATISSYLTGSRKVMLNRALGGLYAPGSIVKPYVAIGALMEHVIDPSTQILSDGQISIPNPYNPSQPTIFRDYAPHNGYVDMRHALQKSSNIYFYEVGGGYRNQKGIGIDNIKKYATMFGIGQKTGIELPGEVTGVVPDIEWKKKNFPKDPWRIGDTYNTAIGQYGFQVTPIQMLRAVSAIANRGTLLTPTIQKVQSEADVKKVALDIPNDYFSVVQEGMRLVATEGTAASFATLPVHIAAKTGTAETGYQDKFINSWVTAFFPYESPKYALVIAMEKGPGLPTSAQFVARDFFNWLPTGAPEYAK